MESTHQFAAEKLPWAENCNSPERMELQQIGIAGNNDIGAAVEGNFQKFVILGIATALHRMRDLHNEGQTSQQAHELVPVCWFKVAVEFRAAQYLIQLRQGRFGK